MMENRQNARVPRRAAAGTPYAGAVTTVYDYDGTEGHDDRTGMTTVMYQVVRSTVSEAEEPYEVPGTTDNEQRRLYPVVVSLVPNGAADLSEEAEAEVRPRNSDAPHAPYPRNLESGPSSPRERRSDRGINETGPRGMRRENTRQTGEIGDTGLQVVSSSPDDTGYAPETHRSQNAYERDECAIESDSSSDDDDYYFEYHEQINRARRIISSHWGQFTGAPNPSLARGWTAMRPRRVSQYGQNLEDPYGRGDRAERLPGCRWHVLQSAPWPAAVEWTVTPTNTEGVVTTTMATVPQLTVTDTEGRTGWLDDLEYYMDDGDDGDDERDEDEDY